MFWNLIQVLESKALNISVFNILLNYMYDMFYKSEKI